MARKRNPDEHLTTRVAGYIERLIEAGTLRPGDRIPPEREFAARLKVSRASLRTGIGYLAAMGVLKVRHGVGTFVAEGPPAMGALPLSLLTALHGFRPWQMFEARRVLEVSLASMAARRALPHHLTALAEAAAEMHASLDDPQTYLIHDIRFHRTIAEAAGNPILGLLMEAVASALYAERQATVEHSRDRRQSAEMHREIDRAIRTGNANAARRAMEKHLQSAEEARRHEPAGIERPRADGGKQRAGASGKARQRRSTIAAGAAAATRRDV